MINTSWNFFAYIFESIMMLLKMYRTPSYTENTDDEHEFECEYVKLSDASSYTF